MPKVTNHVHKLKKHKYKTGNTIFFCTLPDCYFKIEARLMLGKNSICNVCGDEFTMDEYALKLQKPHCEDCGKVKIKDKHGNDRYIRKVKGMILHKVADETNQDLRSRLTHASTPPMEDDI